MKPTTLTQAVITSLTAITLTACGGGDDGGAIYGVENNSTPIVPTITPTVTPNPAPTAPDFVALAKQAGLNDVNAELFAQNAKYLAVDSADFQDALVQAIKAQQADNAIKQNTTVIDPIAKPVDTANPFINGVDVSKQPTMGSSHYVRQMGSNYERTANPEAMAGLGAVATDDPTKSNPWLSNYVLGVEAIRDGDGSVKVVAIDSTGEMAVSAPAGNRFNPTNENEGATLGQTEFFLSGLRDSAGVRIPMKVAKGLGNSQLSPYVINNGLIYTTQRGGGGSFKYKYAKNNITENGTDNGRVDEGDAYRFVITIQKQNATHRDETSQLDADNALSIAKNQTPFPYIDDPLGVASPFNKHAAVGLLVYNKHSKNVVHQKGKELGYKKPIYGKEENVYMLNEDTNEYEVINGVGIEELGIPRADRPNRWYTSRYGSWEMLRENNSSAGVKFVIKDNSTVASTITNGDVFVGRKVANNDGAHIYGKNFVSLDAGAEGKQIKNNTYTGKYKVDGTLGKIAPDKLHNVQYGRLTNNIDILALSEFDNHTGQPRIIHRQFQPHGAPNTVDTYFYRGTNHTTMDEMASIKARGGTYRYHGHALTYNLGPYVNTAPVSTGGIPTAYGSSVAMSSGTTIGNFVEATFDAGKGKVTGSIYNFLNKDHSNKEEDFKKQDLATFKGDVFGNTVVGTSAKVGTNEVGSFTGSFFGQGASELGGNISSISREQGYGDAKWGAVFGATRGTVVDNYNVVEQ